MGIEVERDPAAKFSFRVKEVPQALADLWSSRAKEIEAEIREQGVSGAKAKALAALSTREVKGHRALAELKEEWVKTATEHGFTAEDAARIFRTRSLDLDPKVRDSAIDRAVSDSINQLTAKDAHFCRNDIVRDACIATVHQGIDPTRIAARVDETLRQEQFISLGGRDQRFTTRHIYEEIEGRAHTAAEKLSSRTSRTVEDRDIERAIARSPQKLNPGQRAAVEAALKGPDLVLMEGPPGAGKSTLFKVVRKIIEKDGGKVYATASARRIAPRASSR
jgi:ATP-dependent exoDNAse (exonuclease V) alpha subunit